MRIIVDEKRDIMRIKFQDGKYEESVEVSEGFIIDLSKDKKILAIEILNASERIPKREMKEVTLRTA